MRFGALAIRQALGAILAHSIAVPGRVIKKGRPLTEADLAALERAGVTTVFAATLSSDDVGEDLAARRVGEAVAGAGVRVAEAFTGRCNLFARAAGLVAFDAPAVTALNDVDERITLASVRPGQRVGAGEMLATVKIIPYAVPAAVLDCAVARARAIRLTATPFIAHRAGLVLTRLAATRPDVLEKRQRVIADRLARAGSSLGETALAAHDPHEVAAALHRLAARGWSPLLVFGAAAIADRGDVVPAGLVAAGGAIERLGMPVDPGNLLMLGRLGATPVIGVPSCAASPKHNGFDAVLERVLTGARVTSADIAAMGLGGLLKEIASRPQPRLIHEEPRDGAGPALKITAIVLAAGRSTRMGTNKLLEVAAGKPIIRHVVEAIRASAVKDIVVVTGHQASSVAAAVAGLDVRLAENPDFEQGLSSSLRAGLAGLDASADGVLVALGDMPEVTGAQIDRMIAAFAPEDGRAVVVPVRRGKRGNPVLWARAFAPELATLSGDAGAKHLLGVHADAVVEVDLESDAVLTDIDTPEALAALRARLA